MIITQTFTMARWQIVVKKSEASDYLQLNFLSEQESQWEIVNKRAVQQFENQQQQQQNVVFIHYSSESEAGLCGSGTSQPIPDQTKHFGQTGTIKKH